MRKTALPPSMSTRQMFGQTVTRLGEMHENLIVIDADISRSLYTGNFAQLFPERHINVGIAEQNQVGVAAGLALTGYLPLVCTYAVFASMRAIEQFRTSICYPNLNVKIVASHGGITPGNDGATHQAIEDLGIMRTIPNVTIVAPCDAVSCDELVTQACALDGPVYIRLTRDPLPHVYLPDARDRIEIGKAVTLREGSDLTIFAIGDMVQWAIEAHDVLLNRGISARVVDMHTLKPLDRAAVVSAAKETSAIVTVEDHSIFCGLGSAIAETLVETIPVPLERIGMPDTFGESGPYERLLHKFGMSTDHICQAAERVLQRKKALGSAR